ncbi:MAG: hypothetical protein JW804_03970 [Sedimentisphaerales bacterium]|nr:hypothetical protein [Sedimentisphaerales bacterium]
MMSMNSQMINSDYKNHIIFSDLSEYIDFYQSLSHSIFVWFTMGTSPMCNIDSYLISSIQGTIESIQLVLSDGKINDSYALTRKYHDLVVINIYEIIYLKANFSIENFVVQKINNWIHNKKEKLPRYADMMAYIRKSTDLTRVNKLLDLDGRYNKIRDKCNDHTHYNLFYYMMLNDNQIYLKDRSKHLDELSGIIRDIFVQHFIWLFTLNGHFMAASDYVDSLDCGLIPEEDSQSWVAPFVQKAFDGIIKKYRIDLATELKNTTCMKLE